MSLWRGHTLTDRGRVREQLQDEPDEGSDEDGEAGQVDLQRWTG